MTERLEEDLRMPRIGQRIADRYEVLSVLGEGGFAVVFRALDTKLGGEVAVKVLDPDKSNKQSFIDRFYQEVNLVRQLRHPHTIRIFDAGMTGSGSLYMTTELIDGEPLAELIARTRGLPIPRAIRIVGQVLRSLAEAHRAKIVHRDLKPGNIMITRLDGDEDFAKVLDFGIAKALSPDMSMVKTQTGMVMCTPAYAAPELLRGREVGPASDLYALGLIFLEMLTGEVVIQGDSVAEIMALQISAAAIPIPDALMGTALGEVLEKLTQKRQELRYQSAVKAIKDLGALKAAEGPLPAPSTPDHGASQSVAEQVTDRLTSGKLIVVRADQAPEDVAAVGAATTAQVAEDHESPAQDETRHVATPEGVDRRVRVAIVAAVVTLVAFLVVLLLTGDEEKDTDSGQLGEATSVAEEPERIAAEETEQIAENEPEVTPEPVSDGTGGAVTVPVPEVAVVPEAPAIDPMPEVLDAAAVVVAAAGESATRVEHTYGDATGAAHVTVATAIAAAEQPVESVAPADDGMVRLVVTTEQPRRARLYIDGREVGRTPFDELIEVPVGSFEVKLRAHNYHSWREDVVADGDELRLEGIRLRREHDDEEEEEAPSLGDIPVPRPPNIDLPGTE